MTACAHKPPVAECPTCESDAANAAGAAAPMPRCACGAREFPYCYGHGSDSCHVGDQWVPAATFRRPAVELVRQLVELKNAEMAARVEVSRLVQTADEYRLQAERAGREAGEWRAAALSLARAVGSYAETGRLS